MMFPRFPVPRFQRPPPRVSVLRIVRRSTAARRVRMQLPPRVVTNRGDAALRQIT